MSSRPWIDKHGVRLLNEAQRAKLSPEDLAAYEADLAAEIRRRRASRTVSMDRAGRESSSSVRTVSGGLPTLGQR